MTAPTQHASTNSTANGADQVTTSTINVSAGDLITIICETAEGVQTPSVRIHNTAGSMVTEDETIGAAADGKILYRETATSFTRSTTTTDIGGTTVHCTGAAASDVGLRIADPSNTHIPVGTTIVSVSAGASYTISNSISGTLTSGTTITLSSDVAADYAVGDSTNGKVWYWSTRVESSSSSLTTCSVLINWGPITGARRYRIKTESPASGDTFPVRANRILGKYGVTGASGGTGNHSITKTSGATATIPCIANFCVRTTNSGSPTVEVDFDGSGTGANSGRETTSSAGNGAGRTLLASTQVCVFIDGYWDATETGTNAVPGTTADPIYNTTVNPGTTNVYSGVVYAAKIVTNVDGGNATATATAYNATLNIQPSPSTATASATANNPVAQTPADPIPTTATATGAANAPSLSIKPSAGTATVTGVAFDATIGVTRPAIPVVTEQDEPVEITAYKIFGAEVSFGDPTAYEGIKYIHAIVSKTDSEDTGDIRLILKQASVEVDASPWTALTTTPTLLSYTLTNYPIMGTGFSLRWEVRTSLSVDAVVTDAAPHVVDVAGNAAATGTALQPRLFIDVKPTAAATATGTANSPTVNVGSSAGSASAAASVSSASVSIQQPVGSASASAAAFDATITISQPGSAFAQLASASGAASNATINVSPSPPFIAVAATAYNAAVQTGSAMFVHPDEANASASAYNATINVSVKPGAATATAVAYTIAAPPWFARLTVDDQWTATVTPGGQWSADVVTYQWSATVELD